jgi:flagellar biosynthesis protein FlhG
MRTLAVTSGKGGVGKTTIACNFATALADQDFRVLLFDADLQLANADILMGVNAPQTLQHVLAGDVGLADVLQEGPNGVMVACGGSGVSPLMHAGPKRIDLLLREINELRDRFDYLILDGGAGLDNRVYRFLKYASECLVVTTPEPAAITDAYALIKVLFKRKRESHVRLVVNQVQDAEEGKAVSETLMTVVRHYLGSDLTYLGSVRRDQAVFESSKSRTPFLLANPVSEASMDVIRLSRTLVQCHAGIETALRNPIVGR